LISHYLDEVLSVCETLTVMRNGRIVRTSPAANETPQSLVNAMVGREITLEYPSKKLRPEEAPVVLEVRGLTRGRELDDISFEIRAGEILGLAGLVGSGRTEVARAVFGADRVDAGEIELEGRPVRLRSPRQAARHGIAMLPENRKEQGLVMIRSVRENVTLATLGDFSEAGLVNGLRERATTRRLASELAIRTPSVDAPVVTLSGGNQQKVLFAKWLVRPPRVLLADEPTRGVDVGAKRQIHELIVELAAAQQPPWMRVVRSVNLRDYGIVVAFLALFIGLTFSTNTFFTQNNFANILDQWAALGLLAIGETICIIAGVFDLSTGAMVSVTAVVACKVALSVSPTMGLVAGVATGLGLGIANGIVIHLTRINSFIGTLAMAIVYAGVAILITGGNRSE